MLDLIKHFVAPNGEYLLEDTSDGPKVALDVVDPPIHPYIKLTMGLLSAILVTEVAWLYQFIFLHNGVAVK